MTTVPSSRPDRLHLIAIGEVLAAVVLAACIWRFGPTGPIPMHIGIHGQVDGWGRRGDQALMIVGCTAMMAVFYLGLMFMARREAPDSPKRRGLRTGRIVVVAMSTLIAILAAEMTFAGFAPGGPDVVRGRMMTATLSAIFLVIGALIGKAGPNPFVGAGLLSFVWSFKSRQAWDKSNRLKGRLFFWIGLAGLVAAPFAPPEREMPALILAILGASVLVVIEGWRVSRAQPDRQLS
jgi:uncharacterized membrane protein